jgi:hypothetical protein
MLGGYEYRVREDFSRRDRSGSDEASTSFHSRQSRVDLTGRRLVRLGLAAGLWR